MKERTKRWIAAAVGGLLCLLMYGIVGGMDCGTIPELRGFLEAMACIAGAWGCFRRAGMVRNDAQ